MERSGSRQLHERESVVRQQRDLQIRNKTSKMKNRRKMCHLNKMATDRKQTMHDYSPMDPLK